MANYENKNFLDLEGLKSYHQKFLAKLNDLSTWSGDYNDLTNKPSIPSLSFDEATETLFISKSE